MGSARRRLDAELVRRGLAPTRARAQELIGAGAVTVGGMPAVKAATLVTAAATLAVAGPAAEPWASRGGGKLAGALEDLDIRPAGRTCLDAGASTGGFTDVLLRAGAARVVAVDVGYGQLAWRLRTDPRVVVIDRTNVRHLERGALPLPLPDLVVADLSFISLTLVVPALARAADPTADLVLLCKPQFEVGPSSVGRGGVVRDPAAWRRALRDAATAGADAGLGIVGACASRLRGPAGNVEFFLHLRAGSPGRPDAEAVLDAAVAAGELVVAGRAEPPPPPAPPLPPASARPDQGAGYPAPMSSTGGSRVTAGVELPREPKQERSRRKQEQLIDAAEDLFATRGFDAVTADDIAAHAGYGTGTFYNYFANKVQVFLVVAGRHEHAVAPALEGVTAAFREGADLRDAVASTVRRILDDRLRMPWLRRTWLRLGLTSPEVAEVQLRIDAEWDEAMAELIALGVQTGALRSLEPRPMATALRVLVDALCDEVVIRGTLEPEAVVDASADLILGLVAPGRYGER